MTPEHERLIHDWRQVAEVVWKAAGNDGMVTLPAAHLRMILDCVDLDQR